MENLNRGLVAVKVSTGVFLSWRILGADSNTTAFNLYRNGTLINGQPITDVSNYVDTAGTSASQYSIRAIENGREQPAEQANVWAEQAKTITLKRPAGGTGPDGVAYTYAPGDASVGDLDGDGDYDIVLKWDPSNAKDNSQSGNTGNVYIDAYTLEGQQLWRIDLGRNIRAGAHYTQFQVFDYDGDGRAEIALKTADGTKDAAGKVIGNADADYRNTSGYILTGPEFLTVFDGLSGKSLATADYIPARGTVKSWGDDYGNRVDRFLAGTAYLDGKRPSMVFSRGYYTRAVIAAWDYRDGKLTHRWTFDSNTDKTYEHQGAHSLSIADVDEDGKQEIIFGAATIDDNGKGLSNTKLCHGDALHVSDMDPNRRGLEAFMVHESPDCYGNHGIEMHDPRNGQIIWSVQGGGDIGRGVAMDVDPNQPGFEAWASTGNFFSATGKDLGTTKPAGVNFALWWDGDLLREILDKNTISKWNPSSKTTARLLTASASSSINGTKATPVLSGDILGDWREEVVLKGNDDSSLVLYTTTTPSNFKLFTLMHDAQYRSAISWQNTAYNQPPHPGFFLGQGAALPTLPADIYLAPRVK
jgi:rhamnogalacturonan endolyase